MSHTLYFYLVVAVEGVVAHRAVESVRRVVELAQRAPPLVANANITRLASVMATSCIAIAVAVDVFAAVTVFY